MATADAVGAPGATQSLSNAQFGQVSLPIAHTGTMDNEPRPAVMAGAPPLASMASTFGTVKSTAAWRKPGSVLPYSNATQGSVFNPYGSP